MASVAYSRTKGQISISSLRRKGIPEHRKGIPVCLVCSETTSSIPSEGRLVGDMKCHTLLCYLVKLISRTITSTE